MTEDAGVPHSACLLGTVLHFLMQQAGTTVSFSFGPSSFVATGSALVPSRVTGTFGTDEFHPLASGTTLTRGNSAL